MIIKYIKYKNMISNESEVEIDFTKKIANNISSELFFKESIKDKERSEISKQGILKKIAIIGKNASYKTSTLISISRILDFIINFKNNVDNWKKNDISINKAMDWLEEEKGESAIEYKIDYIINSYLKHINKGKKSDELILDYYSHFFTKNAFNKDEKIVINFIFFDKETKKDLNFLIELSKNEDENMNESKILLNNKEIDLYNYINEKLLNFKYDFASLEFYNINGTQRFIKKQNNLFLEKAISYLYFRKFNQNIDKLIGFINKLDNSVTNIKYRAFAKNEKMNISTIEREYGFYRENISLNKLSTGTKIFIVYTYFILKNDFIIIDELEQSLHLKLVELLIEIASENNTQLLFSTHSPIIIENYIKKCELYIMELDSKNQLKLKNTNKMFRERDNFINKYLSNLVSNISDNDLDDIIGELFND